MRSALLIVDDDRIYHFLISRLLDSVNAEDRVHEVQQCHSAGQALTWLKEEMEAETAIILLDLNMPQMSGFDFLDALDEQPELRELCRVYIVTSSVNDSDREKADEYEIVQGYFVKPLKKRDLELLLDDEVSAEA